MPQSLDVLQAVMALPIARVPVSGVETLALAVETGLTAYDASYLWLAHVHDAEPVTLNVALARLIDEA